MIKRSRLWIRWLLHLVMQYLSLFWDFSSYSSMDLSFKGEVSHIFLSFSPYKYGHILTSSRLMCSQSAELLKRYIREHFTLWWRCLSVLVRAVKCAQLKRLQQTVRVTGVRLHRCIHRRPPERAWVTVGTPPLGRNFRSRRARKQKNKETGNI